jgi:hypothetical protein
MRIKDNHDNKDKSFIERHGAYVLPLALVLMFAIALIFRLSSG